MKITKELILSWEPCHDDSADIIDRLMKKHCGRKKTIKLQDMVNAYKAKDLPPDDFLWLVLRPEIIPERKLHDIAIFCWDKIARRIWEKYYPDDKRPHEAIRIKKLWLDGKATDEELEAARDAALDAARDAARAAARAAARDAARAAARVAVWAAVWAAARAAARVAVWAAVWAAARAAARVAVWAAVWDAEWPAALDAARDAARDAAEKKIINYVIKVMEKE